MATASEVYRSWLMQRVLSLPPTPDVNHHKYGRPVSDPRVEFLYHFYPENTASEAKFCIGVARIIPKNNNNNKRTTRTRRRPPANPETTPPDESATATPQNTKPLHEESESRQFCKRISTETEITESTEDGLCYPNEAPVPYIYIPDSWDDESPLLEPSRLTAASSSEQSLLRSLWATRRQNHDVSPLELWRQNRMNRRQAKLRAKIRSIRKTTRR